MNSTNQSILLTIDVEDWFQVENFKEYIPPSSWPSFQLRVEENTIRLLDLLDSIQLNNKSNSSNSMNSTIPINPINSPKATFFVLGWIAERLPGLIREIHSRGHEVASHGYRHSLCIQQSFGELKKDLSDSKKLLEDTIGASVFGYRAPSFSINDDILKIIAESDYHYDSSFNSFDVQGRYGHIDLSRNTRNGIAAKISDTFYELPISNIRLGSRILPWGGGGYFRMTPLQLFKIGVKFILKRDKAYLFYLHPWEIDPDQPRVGKASTFYKIRHYLNLGNTHSKLSRFIEGFAHCNFVTCSQYLDEVRRCAL